MNPLGQLIIAGILVLTASLAYPQQADSLSVDQLLQDAFALAQLNPDSAIIIAKDAYEQSLDLNDPYFKARSNYSIGYIISSAGDQSLKLDYYFKAPPFYESISPG